MKKKYLISLIFAFVLLCFPSIINAAEAECIITGDYVRIRSGSGTNYEALYTVNYGTPVTLVDDGSYYGEGCDRWNKIRYKDTVGYACAKYVKYVEDVYDGINTADWIDRMSGNNVTIRSGASTKYSSKGSLSLGANVKILENISASNSGCSTGRWHKIQYNNDEIGYVCSKYVIAKDEIMAKDAAYEQELKNAGFPDTYIPYLVFMHQQHPNWKFVAKDTELDFANAVNSEENKNYMQTTNDNYRISDEPAEGSSWFRVNKGVIAFYMDPRNFLYEGRMFMFEKLDYSSELDSVYPQLIKSVFGSGNLSDDQYTIPMFNAGRNNKINPVHIASRIRLEVGANGSASTSGGEFTWKGETYSGYYNFFNIGAYETTVDGVNYSAVTRGLAYAAKLIDRNGEKWDNIETAITEGSAFLANGYINRGQGTLYYQKFNVSPDAYFSNFTHQYMTNIQAPAIEGGQTYESYWDAEILDQPFIFEIPIYRNMPASTSLPASGDMNDELKTLEVDNYSITPNFDSDILTYEVYVPSNTEKVNVKATTASNKATLTGTGEVELKTEKTDITLTVTAELGNTKKYTLTIIKVNGNNENGGNENNNNDNNNNGNNNNDNNGNENNNNDNNSGNNNNNNENNNGNSENNNNNSNDNNGNENNNNDNNSGNNNNNGNNDNNESNNTVTVDTVISSNSLNVSGSYIVKMKNNTSYSTLHNNLIKSGASSVTLKDKNGNTLSGNSTIGTGNVITITVGNESKSFTLVVNGDTSGDGVVTILDLLQVQKHIKGDKKLSNAYLLAGDTSGDNNVTILDLLQVQKHIKGDKYL